MRSGDGDALRFEDARLFRRDRLQRRTEVLGVVQRDVRDHADAEIEDVGRVETPAQANLADQQVDAGARKVVKGGTGQDLELGRRAELCRNFVNDGLKLGEKGREVILRDRPLVNLDPLGVRNEVGLRHQADAIAGRLQDAGQHGADRALAVGAGDVDPLEQVLRIPERVQQGVGPLQSELDAEATERGQVVERFLVVHAWPRC